MVVDGDTEDSVSFSGVKGGVKSREELAMSLVVSDLRDRNKEEGDSSCDAVGVLLVDEERWRADSLGVNWSLLSKEKREQSLLVESGYCPRTSTSTLGSDGDSEKQSLVGLAGDRIG